MDHQQYPCLLCMETNREVDDSIRVDSKQWQTMNIEYLIEKHLWMVEITNQDGLMCISCWHELNNFHKFYKRIEEVHSKTNTLLKDDCKDHYLLTNGQVQEDFKGLFDNDTSIRDDFEPEILLEQSLPQDFVIENKNFPIKKELEQVFSSENLQENDDKYKSNDEQWQSIKTPLKDSAESMKDPLDKQKRSKTKKFKKSFKLLDKRSDNEELIKKETNILKSLDIGIDSNGDSENPSDLQAMKIAKKKRKNPDEKTGQEYDRFIADNFQIVCSFCHIPLKNFIALRKHFRDEHNKRGFVICCKKKIFSRPLLVDHIHAHLDPNYFQCQHCDKVYSERSTLESHMKTHEMDQQDHRNHVCDNCGKTFVGAIQLEGHKRMHEPGYEKQFSCEECGKLFTTSYSLNYHIQAIHHNKFVNICDICGKTMRCRNQFKLHMEKHNSKESMSMNCDICGLRLTDRRGLRRHKNSQHPVGGKKQYSCHICSKVSPNQEALRTHIRLTHSTTFNHKCTMCDKAFKRPYALREHMATHTGTALYTCPWCPKTFISNGNLHNHRKKAHPQEWEEAHRKKFANILPSDKNSDAKDKRKTTV